MGTNYYLHSEVCPACGRSDEPLHIGKSSAGWCFSLHVTDEITSLDDWRKEWSKPGRVIRNEYGADVSAGDMEACITRRAAGPGRELIRHELDGRWIAHGDGTYDLIRGEFS